MQVFQDRGKSRGTWRQSLGGTTTHSIHKVLPQAYNWPEQRTRSGRRVPILPLAQLSLLQYDNNIIEKHLHTGISQSLTSFFLSPLAFPFVSDGKPVKLDIPVRPNRLTVLFNGFVSCSKVGHAQMSYLKQNCCRNI